MGQQVLLALDLVELGTERPGHLLNLFSSRHRVFAAEGEVDPRLLGAIRYVYENLFKRHDMKHSEVRNLPEFTQDMEEIRRRLLEGYSVEERLEGIPAEQRLKGIPAEERLKGIPAEEVRRHLSPEERLEGIPAEEVRRHLSPEQRARLKRLLEQDEDS
jgi:predicted nucleotidyltransferase